MKLVRLIKMCLNDIYSKVRIGKYLSDSSSVQNGLKQGHALSPLLFNFALECTIMKVEENKAGMKLNSDIACYYSVQNLLSSHLISEHVKSRIIKLC
jgi:hypothetical protein